MAENMNKLVNLEALKSFGERVNNDFATKDEVTAISEAIPTKVGDLQNDQKFQTEDQVKALFAANDALVFKGTIGTDGTVTALPTTGYKAGWTYRVITAGEYAGAQCEIGDMIVAVKSYATSAKDSDWSVIQTNIDGAVVGPVNAADNAVPVFDGATGKVLKNSGFTIGASVPAGAKFTDTTYENASSSQAGLMSGSDKSKLDGFEVASSAEVKTVLDTVFPAEA